VAGVCGPLVGGAFLAQATAAALDVEFAFTERVMPAVPDGLYPGTGCRRRSLPVCADGELRSSMTS
jgi:hypothetical protein